MKKTGRVGLDATGRVWYNTLITTTERKGQNMRHDETRDNTTAIENQIIAADAREETGTTWSECECEACTSTPDYEEWPPVGGGHFNDGMW